ncbi:hypothetical protein V5F77_02155 [Xanthobacter sp. DSM 24535]|uniref:hypothetical protein n=1 Tax=Roseixanthobacter psychrophilus TaxID=3119917 RepID=UPI003729BBB8
MTRLNQSIAPGEGRIGTQQAPTPRDAMARRPGAQAGGRATGLTIARPDRVSPAPPDGRLGLLGLLLLWRRRARSRRELGGLNVDQLRDAGISGEVAKREAAKPFWRA